MRADLCLESDEAATLEEVEATAEGGAGGCGPRRPELWAVLAIGVAHMWVPDPNGLWKCYEVPNVLLLPKCDQALDRTLVRARRT
jgi:hypothetical protein